MKGKVNVSYVTLIVGTVQSYQQIVLHVKSHKKFFKIR
jgi:hypothetical protein